MQFWDEVGFIKAHIFIVFTLLNNFYPLEI